MNFVAIPTAVFESPEYMTIKPGDRALLMQLYCLHSDCEVFTVDRNAPVLYGEEWGSTLLTRLRTLLDAGLLVEVRKDRAEKSGPRTRVFGFAHSAMDVYSRVGGMA